MVIPVTSTDTVTSSVPPLEQLLLVGLRFSQSALSVADQFSVPSPEFCIPNVWPGGLTPSSAVKLKLDRLAAIVGWAGGGAGHAQRVNKLAASMITSPRIEAERNQCLFFIFNLLFIYNNAVFIEATDLLTLSGLACLQHLIQSGDDSLCLCNVKGIYHAILVGISPGGCGVQSGDDSFYLGDVKGVDYAIFISITRYHC